MNKKKNIGVKHSSTFGLFLFFMLLPFEYPLAQYGVGSILRYIGIFTIMLSAIDIATIQHFTIKNDFRISLTLFWILYVLVSFVWAIDTPRYANFAFMYVSNCVMFLTVSMVQYADYEVEYLKKAYVIGLVLLLAYMTFIPGAVTYSSWETRLTLAARDGTTLLDQNYLAAIMIMPLSIVLVKLIEEKLPLWHKLFYSIIVLGSIYYIFATGSRSGLLAAGLIAASILRKNAKQHAFQIVLIITALVLIVPAIYSVMPSDMIKRFSLGAMTGKTDTSAGNRLDIWAIALKALDSIHILFGYGAGSAQKLIGYSYVKEAAMHNFYLAHLCELGLIGFIPFMSLIVRLIVNVKKEKAFDCRCGLIGIMLIGAFIDLLTTKFFWCAMMMMTVCISASYSSQEK